MPCGAVERRTEVLAGGEGLVVFEIVSPLCLRRGTATHGLRRACEHRGKVVIDSGGERWGVILVVDLSHLQRGRAKPCCGNDISREWCGTGYSAHRRLGCRIKDLSVLVWLTGAGIVAAAD